MDRERFRLASDLFLRAKDLPAADRCALLDDACADDTELRAQVDRLLAAHFAEAAADPFSSLARDLSPLHAQLADPKPASRASRSGGSTGNFPTGLLTRDLVAATSPAAASAGEPGDHIGPYVLVERLGEGGFGTVFLAEQQEPVRRRVALKVLKPGMDTAQVVARFEAERQALAMMDHPGIAKVYDAGATAAGRPYFAMELVDGPPLTDYCDAASLTPAERLELFAAVCQAVQHAHQKGVIHRDLKPSNILVARVDGRPVPKVIDFGIAKATDGAAAGRTLFTEQGLFVGTPQYMSPEQAGGGGAVGPDGGGPDAGNPADVDTRSDVYALGVVLYELLTGTTPFDPRTLRGRAYDQIQRMIREVDPPRPSTRLSGMGDALADVAARRRTDPARLGRLVSGELDWVVMKALEKDRGRRYDSAGDLAADVRRYLAHRPVLARPASGWYVARKFARRHRGPVAAGLAVAAAVALGVAGTVVGFVRARADRDAAVHARADEAEQRQVALRAEHERKLALVDGLMTASPDRAVGIVDALRAAPDVAVPALQARADRAPAGSPERLRATAASVILGGGGRPADVRLLVDAVPHAPAAEAPVLTAALATCPEAVADDLAARCDVELDPVARARYAAALLAVGRVDPVRRVLAVYPNPVHRTALIAEFATWHGDLARMPDLVRAVASDADAQSGLCAAVGRVNPQALPPAHRAALESMFQELYRSTPHAGVHAACGWALKQWGVAPPPLAGAGEPSAGRGWFVNHSGLTMMQVPAGVLILDYWDDPRPPRPVFIPRPLYVADREVSVGLYRAFVEDRTLSPDQRPSRWGGRGYTIDERGAAAPSGAPAGEATIGAAAVDFTLDDAVLFCNWLSRREGRTPCYERISHSAAGPAQSDRAARPASRTAMVPNAVSPSAPAWMCDLSADGYRLPTTAEWGYACRTGTATTFPCGDEPAWLVDYAATVLTAGRPGGRLPNRWGLFDMIGGAAELCWDELPLEHPAVVPDRMPFGRRACRRGGTFEAGLVTLRPDEWFRIEPSARRADTGLRVVCGAKGGSAPLATIPGVAALVGSGADPDALWAKAVELRPNDPKVYAARAKVRSRQARFAEAAADYAAATRLDPTDHYSWYVGATASLYVGDVAGYRSACRAMLARFGRTTVPEYAERTAKTCLLDPAVTADPAAMVTVQHLADLAVGPDTNKAHLPYFRLTKGMAEYRAGRYASALTWLTEARATAAYAGPAELADAYLAMTYHRLGRGDEASASLARAAAILRRHPDPSRPATDLPGGPDLLAPHIALREARQLVGAAAGDAAR